MQPSVEELRNMPQDTTASKLACAVALTALNVLVPYTGISSSTSPGMHHWTRSTVPATLDLTPSTIPKGRVCPLGAWLFARARAAPILALASEANCHLRCGHWSRSWPPGLCQVHVEIQIFGLLGMVLPQLWARGAQVHREDPDEDLKVALDSPAAAEVQMLLNQRNLPDGSVRRVQFHRILWHLGASILSLRRSP